MQGISLAAHWLLAPQADLSSTDLISLRVNYLLSLLIRESLLAQHISLSL
jgi:hypothetical protein